MVIARRQRLQQMLVCPNCHGDLIWTDAHATCLRCTVRFPLVGGIPRFAAYLDGRTDDADFQAAQMYNSTFTAKLYNIGKKFISSEYAPRDHIGEFLRDAPYGSRIVELGSGDRRLRDDVITVDLFPFPNVDVIADIVQSPFRDNEVEFVVLDSVLEHVPEPHRVVEDVYRILRPGGRVICITPFVFPYHGYPKHYFNISKDGLEFLYRNFSQRRVEMSVGPTSTLVNLVAEYFAVAVSGESKFLYTASKGAALLPTFLFKYLDRLWNPTGWAVRVAGTLCILATK